MPLVKAGMQDRSKKGKPLLRGYAVPPGLVPSRRTWTTIVGLLVAGFALFLYLRTLAPTVLYYDRPTLLDSAMFQAQLATLGITHPTGYPTYTMLGHLFSYLPIGDLAYSINLFSAIMGGAAVFVLYLVGLRLTGSILGAGIGALAFGIGDTYWSQAIIAEVYTLNALFISSVLLLLLLWRDTRRDRYLLGACFLMGLSLTHHVTSGLLLPGAAIFVFAVDKRTFLRWRIVLKGAGLFLIGLLPYLYLPIRASMNPPMNEADPTTPARFWELVNGGNLTGVFGTFGPDLIPLRLSFFGGYMGDEFHVVLLFLAMFGAIMAVLKDRASAALLGFLFLTWLAYAIEYEIFDFFLYFIPPYLILALFMAFGVAAVFEGVRRLTIGSSPALQTAAVLLLFAPLLYFTLSDTRSDYGKVDRSNDLEGREIIEDVAGHALPDSTILHHRSTLWYMVLVENRRRDLTLVSPWYPSWHRYTDLVWPDDIDRTTANLRWGTNDYTGVAAAEEAADRNRPVYILNQPSAGAQHFYKAGWQTVKVEGDLFELVPPGRQPFTPIEEQRDG